MINYYKILGVPDFAPNEDIKTAYRKLSKKFHPDVNDGDKFFEGKFKEIQSAYEALNDITKRNKLDDFLRKVGSDNNYQNFQKQESTESTESQTKEQANSENDKKHSQTTKETKSEQNNQQTNSTIPEKSINNGLVFTAIILVFVFVVYLAVTSNENQQGVKNDSNYSRTNSTTPSPQQQENYKSPSTPEYKKNYPDEVPYSTNGESRTDNSTSSGNFSIGSSKSEVLRIQGNPTSIMKLDAINKEIWNYGISSVTFSSGQVSEYSDLDKNLKVQYSGGNNNVEVSTDDYMSSGKFSIGSSKSEVLRIQGTPTGTMKLDAINKEIWSYGISSVTFSSGKVSEYSNLDNNLKVQY